MLHYKDNLEIKMLQLKQMLLLVLLSILTAKTNKTADKEIIPLFIRPHLKNQRIQPYSTKTQIHYLKSNLSTERIRLVLLKWAVLQRKYFHERIPKPKPIP